MKTAMSVIKTQTLATTPQDGAIYVQLPLIIQWTFRTGILWDEVDLQHRLRVKPAYQGIATLPVILHFMTA